jgi:hypothetical protein
MDRVLSILALLVGVGAIGVALFVQIDTKRRVDAGAAEIAALHAAVADATESADAALRALSPEGERAPEPAVMTEPDEQSTAAAILALQLRMAALEEAMEAAPPAAGAEAASANPENAEAPVTGMTGPTDDCIPAGTRFMAQTGDSYPICETPVVINVTSVTADMVQVEGLPTAVEAMAIAIPETPCTLMVFSADVEGFAEMRVACQ